MRLFTSLLFAIISSLLSLSCSDDSSIQPSSRPEEWLPAEDVVGNTHCTFSSDLGNDTLQGLRPVLIEELLSLNDFTVTDVILKVGSGKFQMIKNGRMVMAGEAFTTEKEFILTHGREIVRFTIIEQSVNEVVLHNDTEFDFGCDVTITLTTMPVVEHVGGR